VPIVSDFGVFSELYGSTVVLRQLKSLQAKRRGRRALEVGFIYCELRYCVSSLAEPLSLCVCVILGAEEAGSSPNDVPLLRTSGPWLHCSVQCRGGGRCPVSIGSWG
jgi:hypothetical protein